MKPSALQQHIHLLHWIWDAYQVPMLSVMDKIRLNLVSMFGETTTITAVWTLSMRLRVGDTDAVKYDDTYPCCVGFAIESCVPGVGTVKMVCRLQIDDTPAKSAKSSRRHRRSLFNFRFTMSSWYPHPDGKGLGDWKDDTCYAHGCLAAPVLKNLEQIDTLFQLNTSSKSTVTSTIFSTFLAVEQAWLKNPRSLGTQFRSTLKRDLVKRGSEPEIMHAT